MQFARALAEQPRFLRVNAADQFLEERAGDAAAVCKSALRARTRS